MKRFKRIIILIMLMIIALIWMIKTVNAADFMGEPAGDPWFNAHSFSDYRNLYCIEPGESLPGTYYEYGKKAWWLGTFYRRVKVVITGDTATFHSLCGKTSGTIVAKENNILAAIVTETSVDGRRGPDGTTGTYSYGKWGTAQQGVYKYLNTWIAAMNLNGTNLATDNFIAYNGGSSSSDAIWAVSEATQLANKYKYNATLYFYTCSGNGSQGRHFQSLMTAHFKDPEPQSIEIPVQKEWNDYDNKYGTRPGSITVKLYKNNTATDKTLTLNAANGWKGTFTELDEKDSSGKTITYTVKEETNTAGYTAEITGNQKNGYTITNKYRPDSVEITGKVWNNGQAGKDNNIVGTLGPEDKMLDGITVTLVDQNGNTMLTRETANGGVYTFQVKFENDETLLNLEKSYVKFEYDGIEYTTVAYNAEEANGSKAKEDENTRINVIDKNYSKVPPETNKEAARNITASTQGIITLKPGYKYMKTKESGNDSIIVFSEVNLGLFEREKPDLKIKDDLYQVDVTMNGQSYTYLYNKLDKWEEEGNADLMAQFQNKKSYTYRRPVNPADIAEFNEDDSMYVTYKVTLTNEATSLISIVHSITNCYDTRYTLESISKEDGTALTYEEVETSIYGQQEEFTEKTIRGLDIEIGPHKNEIIFLKYKVEPGVIKELLKKDASLGNAVEIESYTTKYGEKTLYAEQRTLETDISENVEKRKGYAGVDKDSTTGNAGFYMESVDFKYYEDGSDTPITYKEQKVFKQTIDEDDDDIAPSLILCKDDPKTLSGTIWEDATSKTSDEGRLGNGKIDSNEKTVGNVKVELYKLVKDDATGKVVGSELAKLYNAETKQLDIDARVYSEADGSYAFEGVVTGEYFIKYTYGNNTEDTEDTETICQKEATYINATDNPTKNIVNARNYKSTIIPKEIDGQPNPIKTVLQGNYGDDNFDKAWHVNHTKGYSVAVDNMKDRLSIPDLQYSNYDTGVSISAYTKPFKTLVEFETSGSSGVNADGDIAVESHVLDKLDFGISERPQEDLIVQKTITEIKLTLANGQELINGNPMSGSLSYVKAMGLNAYDSITTGLQARNALEKQLLVEVDAELIQGAQLTLGYKVKVINNNEKDYDYGADYTDIVSSGENGNYITTNGNANYYYYGENKDNNGAYLSEMEATIEIVDYMSEELVYNAENTPWDVGNANNYKGTLISENVANAIKGKYQLLEPKTKSITIGRGAANAYELEMTASRVLANKEDNVYDNSLEIIKIDGKTARTIQESEDGKQVAKSYQPGNYIPSTSALENDQQDDDRVEVIITPPTGIIAYIITYVITGLVGLIVIVGGIVFIKKKILIK